MQLRDGQDELVALGDATIAPQDSTQLVVSVAELGEGIYTVEYRVLSALDGHFTPGSFAFGVGDPEKLQPLLQGRAAAAPDLLSTGIEAVLRWSGVFAEVALVGGMAFGYFLWRGALQSGRAGSTTHQLFISRLKRSSLLVWGLLLLSHLGSYGYRALQEVSGARS